MKGGRRLAPPEPLQGSRQRTLGELKRLPDGLKSLEAAPTYPVTVSEALKNLAAEVDALQAHAYGRD
jgi:nicotinate phosphoribosyltransferase